MGQDLMKRLLLLLPLLLLTGCRYGSMREARAACNSWASKSGYIWKGFDPSGFASSPIRDCEHEKVTRQVLGYDIPGAQAGTRYLTDGDFLSGTFTNENGHVLGRRVVTKRFKY